MAKKKKDVKIDAEINGNKLTVERTENALNVEYDGKKRDIKINKDEDSKEFVYDGEKLDVELKKTADKTEISVNSESKIWKVVGKILGKIAFKRFIK